MSTWCAEARKKLAEMETLVAQGRGDTLVQGGGCTEPGGGIAPTTRTARETVEMMRGLLEAFCPEQVFLNGAPVVGFGDEQSEKQTITTVVGIPVLGILLGSAGGALVAHSMRSGAVGAVVGSVAGTAAGGLGGILISQHMRAAAPPQTGVGVGVGQAEAVVAAPSPWGVALATSVLGAATGWVIEEIASGIRGRRR